MARTITIRMLMVLIALLVILTACAGFAQPTPAPTVEPTAAPTKIPEKAPEPVQIKMLPSQVVVEKILVGEPDAETGELDILVQGSASNTCTTVGEVTVSRDGNIFGLHVDSEVSTDEMCEAEVVPFEETVTVSTDGLTPGTYLVTSGMVAEFELAEQAGESSEGAAEGEVADLGTSPEEGTPAGDETPATGEEAVPTEPRDCEDLAAFVADVTYPDNTNVQPGEVITKTWEIRNQGTCSWGSGYALKFTSGSFSQVKSLSDPFPEAAPADQIQVSVVLTTPLTAGTHSGVWVIQRPEEDNVEIQVGKAFDLWAILRVSRSATGGSADDSRTRKDGMVCAQGNSVYEGQLLQLINNARASNGLPAYEVQSQLTDAARVLSDDMACNNFIDHTGSDGSDWFDRITAQGYNYRDAAENIRFGYGTVPEQAFNWWMDSSIHRGNILSADLTQIGIAYALNPQTGGSYYTLVFADPEE